MTGSPSSPRRTRAYMNTLTINYIHYRNPWIVAWWSAAFPGFGQIMLCQNYVGYILIAWEYYINVQSHLNLAIAYTMTGRFADAGSVLEKRWILLYIPVYIFSIWDCYRRTNEMNLQFALASREGFHVGTFRIGAMELNYLDKRAPWISAAWSAFLPGLAYVYLHRVASCLAITVSWVLGICHSRFPEAVYYTFMSDFTRAVSVLDPEWLLFLPSLYVFSIYDSYVNAVEYNKLFEADLIHFLKRAYQDERFPIPV